MPGFKRILVAIDTQAPNQEILQEAASIALRDGASIKLFDAVPAFPWSTRLLLRDHHLVSELLIEDKRKHLEKLAAQLRTADVEVSVKVLQGKTSVAIVQEVLRGKHDLVIRVAKGPRSRRRGNFGSTATQLLRACPCAVYLAAPKFSTKIEHVMACLDTSTGHDVDRQLNASILAISEAVSQSHNSKLSIVHAWSLQDENLLRGRIASTKFRTIAQERENHVEGLLNEFLNSRGNSSEDSRVHMLKGPAPNVIAEFQQFEGVDLVVMGTIGRSGAAGFLIGNTAEQILGSIDCSVLAVKPNDFVSPIKIGDYVEPNEN